MEKERERSLSLTDCIYPQVQSREYFFEAMNRCLRQNGKKRPSAVSYEACMYLLQAAVAVKDYRMHEQVRDYVVGLWLNSFHKNLCILSS